MRLTTKDINYILENHNKLSLRAMAKEIGCSYEAVNNNLRKAGINKKRVKMSKIWTRECRGNCGTIITNDRSFEYCPRCRHIRHAKTFFAINIVRKAKQKEVMKEFLKGVRAKNEAIDK